MNPSIFAVALMAAALPALAEESGHTNAIYVSPISMIAYSGITDATVISVAYEHRLTTSGYSLFVPLHAAYKENRDEFRYALGAGLGLRKYFGTSFSGTYFTAQSDLVRYQTYDSEYLPYVLGPNGMYTGGQSIEHPIESFFSVTQVAFGYKWDWYQFTLDMNFGAAFYAKKDEKNTNVIGAINLGFPFSAKNFGFH